MCTRQCTHLKNLNRLWDKKGDIKDKTRGTDGSSERVSKSREVLPVRARYMEPKYISKSIAETVGTVAEYQVLEAGNLLQRA
jgi:hypothetical protein